MVVRYALFAWALGVIVLGIASLSHFLFATRRENAFARLLVSLWASLIWPLACFSPDGRRLLVQLWRGR